MEALIALERVRYRYPGPAVGWVLGGIDLSLQQGEYVFVLGASGSGKSTLGYLFNGLVPHFFGGTLQGTVRVNGSDTARLRVSDLFPTVGMVLQNSDAQLFNSTVENEIAFGLESLGLRGDRIDGRIRWVAETLGIEALLDRPPTALSGGEKRLVAIASVLCLDPPLMLLDEPYAHLDWEGVGRVRDVLRRIHRSGKAVVVIEQRVDGFLREATRCIILEGGRICHDGPPSESCQLLRQKRLLPDYSKRQRGSSQNGDSAVMVERLCHEAGGKTVLRGVSLHIRRGETVAIVGKNGAGKTTLVKHFNGLLRPAAGQVKIFGRPIRGKSPAEIAKMVGIAFQNPNDQFFKYRVRDELLAGPMCLKCGEDAWLDELCSLFELDGLMDRSPYNLSEGQKRRVALASILAMRPGILVLDEPTAGQDARYLETLADLINAVERGGITTVVVTHDLGFARAVASRWLVMDRGEVVADGPPEQLLTDARLVASGALAAGFAEGSGTGSMGIQRDGST